MSGRLSSTSDKASADRQFELLFKLYDVQKNKRVCTIDFEFVHKLAQQFMGGTACYTGKSSLLRASFSEEYGKAAFSNVDLDGDGSISWHDFHGWLTALMDRGSKCAGNVQRDSLPLVKHAIHMLQTDKCFLAYCSLALAAKRAAEQADSRPMLADITRFQKALCSAEALIKDDDVLAHFQCQLKARQLDLKQQLFSALAAAQTLQSRESALREVKEARSDLLLEPTDLAELKHYNDIVKASQQSFIIHVSTLSGPETRVEASPDDSVWSLRMKVTAELKQCPNAYQTTLSNMQGKLENDSMALRECLLCLSQGEWLAATYKKADRWVELSHHEFKEFRCKEADEAARLHRAAQEAEKKARCDKSQGSIMESMVRKAEAYCHKTWQEATFEDILIEAAAAFGRMERRKTFGRMVRALKRRGLVEAM